MATARSIRSNAAPASNRPHTKHQSSSRPELRVVSNPRGNEQGNVVGRVIEWTRTRSAPLVHVAIAVIFLVGTLFGALMLRTQMVQNSFEAAQIETNIEAKNGKGAGFERIRRITGYLVGTLDRFNDAKRAEEHDRVKHEVPACCK